VRQHLVEHRRGLVRVAVLRDQDVVLDEAPLTGSARIARPRPERREYAVVACNAIISRIAPGDGSRSRRRARAILAGTAWRLAPLGRSVNAHAGGNAAHRGVCGDGSLQGSAGCNTYSGSYVVDGNRLAISALEAGNQVCNEPAGVMAQEAAFLADLGTADTFQVDGDRLLLSNSSGQVVLEATAYTP
jgi:heat shock protein HslJ